MKHGKLLKTTVLALACIGVCNIPAHACEDKQVNISPNRLLLENEDSEVISSEIIVEEDSSSVAEEASSSPSTLVQIKNNIQEAWDTYVAPLMTGVSITAMISLIVNVILGYLNHKNSKFSKENVAKSVEEISEVYKLYMEYKSSNEKIIEELKNQTTLSEETKTEFLNKSNALLNKCAEVINKTEKLESLKVVMTDLATIIAKLSLASKEMVKAGITEDVAKLEEHIKEL